MPDEPSFFLEEFPVHLGLGAAVLRQNRYTGDTAWYQEYEEQAEDDGDEGRLVMMYTFVEPSSTWEVHTTGQELVLCTMGSVVLHQELGNRVRSTTIQRGQAVINPPGVWHTIDVDAPATALFVTPSRGTEVRPR